MPKSDKKDPDYWYENRNLLQPGMIFRHAYEDIYVRLDRRVPGDGTQWYADIWIRDGWSSEDFGVEPSDLTGEPLTHPPPAE